MDLEYFLGKTKKNYKIKTRKNYNNDKDYQSNTYSRKYEKFNLFDFIQKIKNNRQFKILIIGALVVFLLVVIGLIALIYPLLTTMIDFVAQNGISGVIDLGVEFLNKLWNGTKQ